MRKAVKYGLTLVSLLAMIAAAAALLMFPHTNPWVIHTKTRLIGSRLVYRPLAYEDERWELVLRGVRSGSDAWLRVAADLRPALDTHPGEEMLGAVSSALDANPAAAVQFLVPQYGAEVVCGQDENGLTIARAQAEHRARLLEGVPEAAACLGVIRSILKEGAVERRDAADEPG